MRSQASSERFWSASDAQLENRAPHGLFWALRWATRLGLLGISTWTFFERLPSTLKHLDVPAEMNRLAKTVNLDWRELGNVRIFGAFLHSDSGSNRKSAPWWNVLKLKSSTSAWRGDGKWGACQDILEASCLDTMRLSRQEKGRCDFKTFTPVEEL